MSVRTLHAETKSVVHTNPSKMDAPYSKVLYQMPEMIQSNKYVTLVLEQANQSNSNPNTTKTNPTSTPPPLKQFDSSCHLVSQKLSRSVGNFDFAGDRAQIRRPREQRAATAPNNLWCIRDVRIPHFQDTPGIESRLSKKNVVSSENEKIKRQRAPGVGFEPTRSAWSQISVKRPDH